MTQLDVLNRQTTPTQHTRVLGSSFRCLDKEGKRPQKVQTPGGVVHVRIPPGLQPGMAFQVQAPAAQPVMAQPDSDGRP